MDQKTPDGQYGNRPWQPGVNPPSLVARYQYLGPFASNEERLTQQAIQSAILPGNEIAELARVNLPQVDLFPPRFGYGERTAPTIMDIVEVNRRYTEPRVSWFSGSAAGYQGTSRNTLGNA
jgi:hypothetical protein